MRTILALPLLLVGCQPPPTHAAVPDAIAAPSPVAATPASPMVAPLPTALPPSALAVTPVPTSWPDAALVLAPIDDDGAAVLFADEREALRAEIAARLTRLGVALVPIAELQSAERAAAAGTLALESDRHCKVPVAPHVLAARHAATSAPAEIELECAERCWVGVRSDAPEAHPLAGRSWRARGGTRVEGRAGWTKLARGLRAGEVPSASSARGGGSRPGFALVPLETTGPWTRTPEDAVFTALDGDLAACGDVGPRVSLRHTLRFEVAPGGEVARCELQLDRLAFGTRPELERCACGVVQRLTFAVGGAGRRLRADLLEQGRGERPAAIGWFRALQTGTQAWVDPLSRGPILGDCVDAAAPRELPIAATFGLVLEADGTVGDVHVASDSRNAEDFLRCVAARLAEVELPCAPPGIDELRLGLELMSSAKPTAKRKR